MPGIDSQRLLESRRNELHLLLRALNKRIVEGSLHTYLTVNRVTHPPVMTNLPDTQATLAALRDGLRTLTQNTGNAVVSALESLAVSSDVWRFEQILSSAKSTALTEIAAMINHAFKALQSADGESAEDDVLGIAVGVESVTTTVTVFLAQLCTTLVERRDKLARNGHPALVSFANNAFESLFHWIGAILPAEASVSD
jgi:hypothetical protein